MKNKIWSLTWLVLGIKFAGTQMSLVQSLQYFEYL